MKECLDQFIKENRPDFDDATPPARIWEKVSNELTTKKRTGNVFPIRRHMALAAAIAVAVIGIVVFLIAENRKLKNDLTASQQQLEQQNTIVTDYNKEINQFTQIVAVKQKQLSIIRTEYPSLYQSFTSDIKDLNHEYEKLKEELKAVPEKDEVLDAMIQNLRLQAELLNEQLLIIQQLKSSKKNKNEKATPVI